MQHGEVVAIHSRELSAPLLRREKIEQLDQFLLTNFQRIELPVEHFFTDGVYTRLIRMPAGSAVTGKIHRFSCPNFIMKGKLLVYTDEANYDIVAPFLFISGPGVRKALYVEEDTIWLTSHAWDGPHDVEMVEKHLIVPMDAQAEMVPA